MLLFHIHQKFLCEYTQQKCVYVYIYYVYHLYLNSFSLRIYISWHQIYFYNIFLMAMWYSILLKYCNLITKSVNYSVFWQFIFRNI